MKNNIIAIIGGCGHVGLPLALKFAEKKFLTYAIDINQNILKLLNNGNAPYKEKGSASLLKKFLNKKIFFTENFKKIKLAKYIIITVGTPLKGNNPDMSHVFSVIRKSKNYISKTSSIILRSTVFPGTTRMVMHFLKKNNIFCKVSYCPERVAQGKSLSEIENLPQIVSSENENEQKKINQLFRKICKKTLYLNIEEAEYAKLFSNAWRYIKFGITNEFYMLCENASLNYNKILNAMKHNYPRNNGLPMHGFAGGPCLPKDAIQLFSSSKKFSTLIKRAYNVNENLPAFLINQAKKKIQLKKKNVCVLGTTFKQDIDDERGSLSIKLIKLLKSEGANVYVYDPYIKNNSFQLNKILKICKIVFIGTPHSQFRKLNLKNKILFSCWGTRSKVF
jgi:UDP-N-acetyl-D-mannosaminuronic acid dehydrogenase